MPRRRSSPTVLALLLTLFVTAAAIAAEPRREAAEDQPAPGAPAWARKHLSRLIGRWVADNGAYKSDNEPFDAYVLEWAWGPGEKSVEGRLLAAREGAEPIELWEYRVAWHPGKRALILQQWSPDGSYAAGRIEDQGEGASEALQTLYQPDGGSTRIGHRERLTDEGKHSDSFVVTEDGVWQPSRTYLWRLDGEREPRPADGLGFLQPFVGVWLPHPDWEPLARDPRLRTLVPLNLRWGGDRSFLEIKEGLLGAGEYDATGILVWNPVTRKAEFLAKQIEGDLVFDGYYEPLGPESVRRVYKVLRPDGTLDLYRETFELTPDGGLDWTTERRVDGVFRPVRGSGAPEFQAIRPPAEPSDALADLASVIGEWRPDPERIPEPMRQWRERHGVEDGFVSFQWGTARRWIEFGEHRKQDGEWRLEGSGLIAWDPARRQMVYREHTDSGRTLEGTLERVGPGTIRRHYRVAHPDGSVARWRDTWRWDGERPGCFEWTTTRIQGDSETAREPYWVCATGER